MDKLTETIEEWLKYKGHSQDELAKAIGISRPTLVVRLSKPSSWTVKEINNLADFLDCPASELLSDWL